MSMLATPLDRHSGIGPPMGAALAALLLLAGFIALSNVAEPPTMPAPEPTIEDWRGNSATIRPAS